MKPSTRWRLRTAVVALSMLVPAMVGAAPATAAKPSPADGRPVITLIPAFDNDLPLSGYQLQASDQHGTDAAVTPSAEWVCSIYASDPTKFANTIEGEGWQSCAGSGWAPQLVRVTLQKYMGLGFWNNLTRVDSGWVYIDFVHRDFIYNCSGLGTQTYRVVTDGYAVGGLYGASVQSLNYLRVTC